ncbi:MAG TPA: molybdenum cofactor guanylyltransferase, partial [Thermoleophilia bacterium]|nr:molybdenum cofactor guanylyltransferase [Thermoleophilia bacterium]
MGQPAVSAIILAGGASSRMGFNKALARLGRGGTLIEKAVAKAAMLSGDVIVVANDEERYRNLGVRVIPDAYPGSGSLGGIYSGLLAAQHQHAFVVACDMPFLSLPLWRYMLSIPRDYDVLLPRLQGQPEPLHAIYSKQCL